MILLIFNWKPNVSKFLTFFSVVDEACTKLVYLLKCCLNNFPLQFSASGIDLSKLKCIFRAFVLKDRRCNLYAKEIFCSFLSKFLTFFSVGDEACTKLMYLLKCCLHNFPLQFSASGIDLSKLKCIFRAFVLKDRRCNLYAKEILCS